MVNINKGELSYIMFILLLLNSRVTIGQNIVTDRPDQTESAMSIIPGAIQVETGFSMSRQDENSMANREWAGPSTLIRLGLLKNLELRFQNELIHWNDGQVKSSGFADAEVGFKYQLGSLEGTDHSMAFLSHFILPTGSGELTQDGVGADIRWCVGHSLNETVGISYNAIYSVRPNTNDQWGFSFSLAKAIGDKAGFFIEPYGTYDEEDSFLAFVDAGFTYLWSSDVQLDFSFGHGIHRRESFVSFGFSWRHGYSKN